MPVEDPSAFSSSTVGGLRDEPIGSACGERQPVVLRSLTEAGDERRQRTTPLKAALETAAESPRLKKRFPQLMPILQTTREDFGLLEKWDGVVLATEEDTFTARLYRADEPNRTIQ